jgi:hypothetical protein
MLDVQVQLIAYAKLSDGEKVIDSQADAIAILAGWW